MLSTADTRLLVDRLKHLMSLDLDHGGKIPGVEVEAIVAQIQHRHTDDPADVQTIGHRYLLHKKSFYENEPDDETTQGCDTLEEVETEVVEYLTQERGREYGFFVDVYDLDLAKKLDYELVRSVKWNFDTTAEPRHQDQG